jgi:hypoxanthine phosphoribosyltransferase
MAEDGKPQPGVTFVHPSEAQFARILDFYQVAWEYEPKTFELRWDDQGNVIEAFTPDFYLPEQDLYIKKLGIAPIPPPTATLC